MIFKCSNFFFFPCYQMWFQMKMKRFPLYIFVSKICFRIKEDIHFCIFFFVSSFFFIWVIKFQFNNWKLSAWQNFKRSNSVYRNVWLQFVTVLWFFSIQFFSFQFFFFLYSVLCNLCQIEKKETGAAATSVSQQQEIRDGNSIAFYLFFVIVFLSIMEKWNKI